ncbi:pyocin knob domain-containing protein [Microbacterium sp. BG28]|uniref:pyocin knob domain-containing protein n=1 Tax=Microbacterium sp. BG28 TaxID=3097356 RepID=UPI002A5A68C7|nr:pyocin knob domain-containing protein [Microbacterium sp. BG28]MDY0829146.1 pyocin knob domain-containing protein [Microbacterium sp. BG28]
MFDLPRGFVAGRFVQHDGETPESGTVKLTPLTPTLIVNPDSPAESTTAVGPATLTIDGGVIHPKPVIATRYKVTFSLAGTIRAGFEINVTTDHTAERPLDLTLAAPIEPLPTVKWVVNEQVYVDTLAARADALSARDAATASATASAVSAEGANASAAAAAASDASAAAEAGVASQSAQDAAAAAAASVQLKLDTEQYRTQASEFSASALQSKLDAAASADAASTARTGAETARAGAEAAANLALTGQFAGTTIAATVSPDTLTTPGVYKYASGSGNTTALGFPEANFIGTIQVFARQAGRAVQIAQSSRQVNINDASRYWTRTQISSGWTSWRTYAAQQTVSPTDQPGVDISLWNDQNNVFQAIFPVRIPLGAVNLDLVTLPGQYFQTSGGNATLANNYPVAGANCVLEVAYYGGHLLQRVTLHRPSSGGPRVQYLRGRVGDASAFTPWSAVPTQRINNPSDQPGVEVFTWDDANNRELQLLGTLHPAPGTSANLDTLTVPGTYIQTSTVAATLANNYPVAGIAAAIEVIAVTAGDTGNRLQRVTAMGGPNGPGRGYWQRRRTSGTYSAWEFYSALVVDQTAGRTMSLYDPVNLRMQMIYGDTGWREVKDQLINGWTAQTVQIRRVGLMVTVKFNGLDPSARTASNALASLAGFRGSTDRFLLFDAPNGPVTTYRANAAGTIDVVAFQNSGLLYGEGTFPTNDAWPTILPGVAVGSVPA